MLRFDRSVASMGSMIKNPFLFLCLLGVTAQLLCAGCERTRVESHGKQMTTDELAKLKIGEHSKGDVLALVGSPTTESPFDQNTWVYSGHQASQFAFMDPALDKQQTIILKFNQEGLLKEIIKRGKEEVRPINPSDSVTPSAGQESSVLNKLFQHQRIFSSREKHEENKGK